MYDDLYETLRRRVQRRLSNLPRLATLNAILFSVFTVCVGISSMLSRPSGNMDGGVYWIIFLWSLILTGQTLLNYRRSASLTAYREHVIYEEILDVGDTVDLSAQEMSMLHGRLAYELTRESPAVNRLLSVVLGNLFLWPGMLIVGLFLRFSGVNLTFVLEQLPLVGTLLLSFAIPVQLLWRKSEQASTFQYSFEKQKRKNDAPRRLVIGDDGEIVPEVIETHQDEIAR
jgi:hypothetical protein